MSTTTTEQLIDDYKVNWEKTVTHPLVKELCAGTLPDKTLGVYLLQDLKYFWPFLKVILKTTYLCEDTFSEIRFGKQIGFICSDENDYFDATLNVLKAKDSSLEAYETETLPSVKAYEAFLQDLSGRLEDHTFGELVTFLWTTEYVYLRWAQICLEKGEVAAGLEPKHQVWIDLHSGDDFEGWVAFLRGQVDTCDVSEVTKVFQKTVDLEYSFFDSCYKIA